MSPGKPGGQRTTGSEVHAWAQRVPKHEFQRRIPTTRCIGQVPSEGLLRGEDPARDLGGMRYVDSQGWFSFRTEEPCEYEAQETWRPPSTIVLAAFDKRI